MALVERARGVPRPPIVLDIVLLGSINRVGRVAEVLDRLYDLEERRHLERPVEEKQPPCVAVRRSGAFDVGG
jgi:hypothetical protein